MLRRPHRDNLTRRMSARIICLSHLHKCSEETPARADAAAEQVFCTYACVAEAFVSVGRFRAVSLCWCL
jgi:hypothetical protein